MILTPNGPTHVSDGCRVAPYVNMPSMRLAFDRLHMNSMPQFDITSLPASHHAAAALSMAPPSVLFYPPPSYAMNLALYEASLAPNKNNSIADLRLKAKKHAATLGL